MGWGRSPAPLLRSSDALLRRGRTHVLVELARERHVAGAHVVAGEGGGVLGGLLGAVRQPGGREVLVPRHGGVAAREVAGQRPAHALPGSENAARSPSPPRT